MLHKARARNARPYGHGGVIRSYFFFRNIVGARIARPLLQFAKISDLLICCTLKKKIGKIGKKSAERFVIEEKERQKKTA